uniref:Uncharacterized protein n=1 Tax=Romanomermis culicivorax TaxID=13658 RepID=A0A915JVL3_ROMCU
MTDVEYCVHVSNKYALIVDDAPDPSDIFQQLAAIAPTKTGGAKDAKKSKDVTVSTLTTTTVKKALVAPQQQETAVGKQQRNDNSDFGKRKFGEGNRQTSRTDDGSRATKGEDGAKGERGGRGGRRGGRGGPRGSFGNVDQQQQENNENRRPRNQGALPPRMNSNRQRGQQEFGGIQPQQNIDGGNDMFFGRSDEKFGVDFPPQHQQQRERGGGRGGRGGRNSHTYNNNKRLKHAELYKNYTENYGYLKLQFVMYCIMSKKKKKLDDKKEKMNGGTDKR